MLYGLMNVSGPTGAVSARGGELESYKSAVDQNDSLKSCGVSRNHGVADVGALRAASKSWCDEKHRTVSFQVRNMPIKGDVASIGCLETFSLARHEFRRGFTGVRGHKRKDFGNGTKRPFCVLELFFVFLGRTFEC